MWDKRYILSFWAFMWTLHIPNYLKKNIRVNTGAVDTGCVSGLGQLVLPATAQGAFLALNARPPCRPVIYPFWRESPVEPKAFVEAMSKGPSCTRIFVLTGGPGRTVKYRPLLIIPRGKKQPVTRSEKLFARQSAEDTYIYSRETFVHDHSLSRLWWSHAIASLLGIPNIRLGCYHPKKGLKLNTPPINAGTRLHSRDIYLNI